ncbi:DUF1672 family protein [Mammaliicoccus sp. Dog046]|uniref:DUF1672 family protein n=1 Tax=Mammaliicoccus sp. Dog046 TaxID=3034233 RepID=UPI002B25F254|nr:DUF1672 family protein [Mammaliicoccus sp. Dog046]WQK85575.1 DUF1672 family protein [Mammaliicoccus sp. Dog046]
MKKIISSLVATSLILGGCSDMPENKSTNDNQQKTKNTKEEKAIPEKMPVQEYKGQGFQPHAEDEAIKFAKKHRKEFEKLGEQFFKDNFSLNVKATNVVAVDDGVEVYVHCNDNGIVFNASIPFTKDSLGVPGSFRSNDTSSEMEILVGKVLSGFEYRAQKEKYDNLTQFYKDNREKYNYTGMTKEAINSTQNVGYRNEYFYILYSSRSLNEYRKYFEPLIYKDDQEFKDGMIHARKKLNYTADVRVVATLFSTQKDISQKKDVLKWIEFTNSIKKQSNFPSQAHIISKLVENGIYTKTTSYDKQNKIEI